MVIDLIVACSKRLAGDDYSPCEEEKTAMRLAEGLVASIPYHLNADQRNHVLPSRAELPAIVPARPVGGLLLMNSIYVATRLPVLSDELRNFFLDHLAWIGTNMGIGLASILSKVGS